MSKNATESATDSGTYIPHTAMTFLCPACESALEYVGSVSSDGGPAPSLTDRFRCPVGCGVFEHERRTHRMRQIAEGELHRRAF